MVHLLLICGLVIMILMGLTFPQFTLFLLPCLCLFIVLLGYYIFKSKHRVKIVVGLMFLFIVLLINYVLVPYYLFQQNNFLNGAYLKACDDKFTPNAPDILVCKPESCKVSNHEIDFGHIGRGNNGRNNQPLKGIIVKREWRIYDGGVVYFQFEPYIEKNRYCLK